MSALSKREAWPADHLPADQLAQACRKACGCTLLLFV